MKSDIDRLMQDSGLEIIVVMGDDNPNPYRDYLANRARFHGLMIKKLNETPFIVASGMELDEARKSGLEVHQCFDFATDEMYDLAAYFKHLNITGRAAFVGVVDLGNALRRIADLRATLPALEIVSDEKTANLFNRAYETKDEAEIAELREVARLTSQLVRETWDFISRHRAQNSIVVDEHDQPLTIGAVKRFIREKAEVLGLDDLGVTIFAQGRDAGMPHSRGEDDQVLEVGKSIVFDIFPRSAGSGYYHDMTRTWCLDHAPDEVKAAYDQVMEIFNANMDSFRIGVDSQQYQIRTLDYFEAKGHKTGRSHPGATEGYVHSLGHGLGLNVHEMPHFSHRREGTPLAPGMVFTIEPGLYYPDRGFGVRVEDT
ncbi:MAG TPA: M24 family metallopeptidase, partial [Aggregatilineales bacterium]|nr:M24 family metallopeptidase [Aggregatilineales bacterium]